MVTFRHIPPTQFLKGFEAAARLESFSRAAEEVGLTQSAISHQMRLLEGQIGQPLFLRVGREVRLTDAGRDYHRTVRRCLDMMEEGYRRLEPYRKPGSVVIYAPQDFARRWLLPRLPALKAAAPACDPWLDTSGATVDFETMEVDIALIHANEPPPGCESLLIARDRLSPVAEPALAATLRQPSDLLQAPLIHEEGPIGWADWLAHAGIEAGKVWKGTNFSDSDMALAAAELGQGVALASLFLAGDALAAGTLVRPFAVAVDSGRAWYALSSADRLDDGDVRDVWSWLGQQATEMETDQPVPRHDGR
ncbi:LysR substrate-binding domain-containing protein [Shinella kummerowiae]|uniref:LysR substrate-binding domain-containing protein n=1 Tax=Shinella kummerowiae TaxID=417745 RepID=UPI0021B6D85A|nr:LysR substrate-binding domain-containing protein [Shinella kummerowiae]MCT7664570.1 LysR substrate-binding domain-containing protein [Shinella kummerowiae]